MRWSRPWRRPSTTWSWCRNPRDSNAGSTSSASSAASLPAATAMSTTISDPALRTRFAGPVRERDFLVAFGGGGEIQAAEARQRQLAHLRGHGAVVGVERARLGAEDHDKSGFKRRAAPSWNRGPLGGQRPAPAVERGGHGLKTPGELVGDLGRRQRPAAAGVLA